MDFSRLLTNLSEAQSDQQAVDSMVAEFEQFEPACAFYCSGSPMDGVLGLQDKVRHGRTVGKLVDDEVLGTILADPDLQAADKFPDYCKNNFRPLVWQCEPTRLEDAGERRFFGLAADFGVTGGITIPIHQLDKSTYGNLTLFFSRDAGQYAGRLNAACSDIHIASLYLHTRLEGIDSDADHRPVLSPREQDCILLLARGYQTAQIADRLALSDATVNEYIRNARSKLKARTRSEAVARAVQTGLVCL